MSDRVARLRCSFSHATAAPFPNRVRGDEGPIRFVPLGADAAGDDPPEDGTSSGNPTLSALVELHRELGRDVSPLEIAGRRAERTGRTLTKESTANQLSRLKKAGLADNPVSGRWVPVGQGQ